MTYVGTPAATDRTYVKYLQNAEQRSSNTDILRIPLRMCPKSEEKKKFLGRTYDGYFPSDISFKLLGETSENHK
jgi:hypothetical protein